jgi:dienelactone hydrolase
MRLASGKTEGEDAVDVRLRTIDYDQNGAPFDGALILPEGAKDPLPGVLVFHGWEGRSEGQEAFAHKLAGLGYGAFCVDLYGKGRRGTTPQECEALMTPLISDRAMLRERLLHVVDVAGGLPELDSGRLAAIGFCFGGLCVLDLARAGAGLKGVASFHGLFTPSGLPTAAPIATKVIAFHGWDDPMVPPSDVVALGDELTQAQADWQIHAFGGAMHAFMAPGANSPEMGIQYHEATAHRAWTGMAGFLGEVLA